MNKAEVQLTWY